MYSNCLMYISVPLACVFSSRVIKHGICSHIQFHNRHSKTSHAMGNETCLIEFPRTYTIFLHHYDHTPLFCSLAFLIPFMNSLSLGKFDNPFAFFFLHLLTQLGSSKNLVICVPFISVSSVPVLKPLLFFCYLVSFL